MEEVLPFWPTRAYAAAVKRAALAKADMAFCNSLGGRRQADVMVLGADTVVVCQGEMLGKPSSKAEARRMLGLLSGRWHAVYTGLALVWGGGRLAEYERTEVAFRQLSEEEIGRYVESGESMDKAGAYGIQGRGAALVRAVRGCYTNVVGLPIPRLMVMLAKTERERG
jgi:septum formation protein